MILVIGGGPAGRIAAMRLAHSGKEVVLLEKRKIGGQCLHHGCMMVCALNDVARTLKATRRLKSHNILDCSPQVSLPRLVQGMQEIQVKIEGILDAETRNAGVTIRYGSSGSVQGGRAFIDGTPVDAEAVIIATGSRPVIPAVPGTDRSGVFTPHTLPLMKNLPKRMAIIGCGIMGAEFAHIFQAFGSDVHLICRSSLLRNMDSLLRDTARKELSEVHIHENALLRGINGSASVESITIEQNGEERRIEVDAVFLASGLVPRSEGIEGVQKGPLGEIIVNDRMQTSCEGVYACGDVIGPPYLTPVARREGMVAADTILGKDVRMDYSYIPQSIGLMNDLAFCTSSSEDSVAISTPAPAGPGSFWAVPSGETGFSRLMVDPETGKITGMLAAAPGAGTVAHYMSYLMHIGYSVFDHDACIETHPSTDGASALIRYMAEVLKERED
jgi:dihydrolipoamide dehydrogenase